MENKKRFYLATLIVAVSNLLSRVLGLFRSTLLASIYGATENQGIADCYNASFVLPDILYNLTVFGVVSIVLVPYFSGILSKQEDKKTLDHNCSAMLNFFFILIAICAVAGWFFAPNIVKNFLVKGFADQKEKIELTIKLTRIMLLQPIFVTLAGILGAYMNARERYTSYAIAVLFYNVGIILGILLLSRSRGIEAAAWGTVFGSFLWFSIQLFGAVAAGYRYQLTLPRFDREFGSLLLIATPRVIALGGEQFVKFFFTNYASFIYAGALTIYSYAENFSMVPYGMIAVSLSTTAFPIFSKKFALGEYNEMFHSLLDKLKLLLFLTLPICIFMAILRYEMIDILLGYRHFTRKDIGLTSESLIAYLIGIPFYSITIVLAKYLYAQKRTFLPMFVSLFACTVTILTSYLFVQALPVLHKVTGLSFGRSTGYIFQTFLLLLLILLPPKAAKKQSCFSSSEGKEIGKVVLLNLLLFPTIFFFHHHLISILPLSGKLSSFVNGIITVSAGVIFYFCTGTILRLSYFTSLRQKIQRKKITEN